MYVWFSDTDTGRFLHRDSDFGISITPGCLSIQEHTIFLSRGRRALNRPRLRCRAPARARGRAATVAAPEHAWHLPKLWRAFFFPSSGTATKFCLCPFIEKKCYL